MLRQFVQIAHDEAAQDPLSLAEVCQMLHVGKSTLAAACKDAYGMSVVALMRKVRLEQCRMALIKPKGLTLLRSVMRQISLHQPESLCCDVQGSLCRDCLLTRTSGGRASSNCREYEALGRFFRTCSRPLDLSPKLRQSDLSPPCSSPTSLQLTCTCGVDLHKNYGFVG